MAEFEYIVVYAKCCRYWPVALGNRVGHCGLCGEVPVLVPEMTKEEYMALPPEKLVVTPLTNTQPRRKQ